MLAHVLPRLTDADIEIVCSAASGKDGKGGSKSSLPQRVHHWDARQLEIFFTIGVSPRDAVLFSKNDASSTEDATPALSMPSKSTTADPALEQLLSTLTLEQLVGPLHGECVAGLAQLVIDDRPALLARLKADGISSLGERQKLANALSKQARELGLEKNSSRRKKAILPTTAVAFEPSMRALTITGKTDGFGAQIQAQMSAIAYVAGRPGTQYVHTPMGPKMDQDLHGVEDEDAADMDVFGGLGSGAPSWEAIPEAYRGRVQTFEYISEVHNATTADLGRYYSDDVRELLRAKYRSTPKPDLPPVCKPAPFIAVHVRRGDVSADRNVGRYTDNATYAALLSALSLRHPGMPLIIFSQGRVADFGDLAELAGGRLCLDVDVRTTFHALVHADVLLIAKSSFSYAAALLSEGTVYADLIERWHHQPLPSWQRLQERQARPPAVPERS